MFKTKYVINKSGNGGDGICVQMAAPKAPGKEQCSTVGPATKSTVIILMEVMCSAIFGEGQVPCIALMLNLRVSAKTVALQDVALGFVMSKV